MAKSLHKGFLDKAKTKIHAIFMTSMDDVADIMNYIHITTSSLFRKSAQLAPDIFYSVENLYYLYFKL